MLKSLAIAAVLVMAGNVSGQPNKTSSNKENGAKQSQPSVVSANTPDKQNSSQNHQSRTNLDPPERNTSSERPEWWLVGVGIATFVVIGWQSWETRRAAEAMRDRDKARLIVRPSFQYLNSLTMTLRVSNIGPTDAEDVAGKVSIVTGPEGHHPSTKDWKIIKIPSLIRPTRKEPIEVQVGFMDSHDLSKFAPGDTPDSKGFRVEIMGIIRYVDVFGNTRRRRFRYVFVPDHIRIMGTAEEPYWTFERGSGSWEMIGNRKDNRDA